MKKFDLVPELEEAIQKVNNAMENIAQDEISEEYAKMLLARIREIIERYYLHGRDAKSILNFLNQAEPDHFLIGLDGKEFDKEGYLKSIELLKIKVWNMYISEKRKRRLDRISLVISFASLAVAIMALAVNAAKQFR